MAFKVKWAVWGEGVRIAVLEQTNQLLALSAALGLGAIGAIEVEILHVERTEEKVDETVAYLTDGGCLSLVVEDGREKAKAGLPIRLIFHVLSKETPKTMLKRKTYHQSIWF